MGYLPSNSEYVCIEDYPINILALTMPLVKFPGLLILLASKVLQQLGNI